MLFDAHNHLQDVRLAGHRDALWPALRSIGLAGAVVNGTEEADWPEVAALAASHTWVWPSYGLHPWHVSGRSPGWFASLTAHLNLEIARGRRPAIGEIGLDRRRKPFDFATQQSVFLAQLGLAAERALPVTIHCLEAWGALADIVQHHPVPACGFLLHAYCGPAEWVTRLADRGAYFSFNGSFLHDRLNARRDVFRRVPADRLLIETDAPAMPLPPGRTSWTLPPGSDGRPLNHPASLADVYPAVAELRGLSGPALADLVQTNFFALFGPRENQLPAGGLP